MTAPSGDEGPQLIENKTARVLINLFNPRDLNDAIKLAKMSETMRDRCLGRETFDREYGGNEFDAYGQDATLGS